jgi:protein TonB
MKFNSLKFKTGSITAFFMLAFVMSCNNESGNNSTTATKETDTSGTAINPSAPTTDITVKKKTGKASAKMTSDADATAKVEKDKMGYYIKTEVLPAYNGGQAALEKYITNNIEYPQEAIDNNVEGTVNVQFLVDEKGNVSNVKTIGNKIGSGLEEEAVRVVSAMPKWSPGQVKGKNVKTWRTLPITYQLEVS